LFATQGNAITAIRVALTTDIYNQQKLDDRV